MSTLWKKPWAVATTAVATVATSAVATVATMLHLWEKKSVHSSIMNGQDATHAAGYRHYHHVPVFHHHDVASAGRMGHYVSRGHRKVLRYICGGTIVP